MNNFSNTPTINKPTVTGGDKLKQAEYEARKWQGRPQNLSDQFASKADNGWGNTQAAVNPYDSGQVVNSVQAQMMGVMNTAKPMLDAQREQQKADLQVMSGQALYRQQVMDGQRNQNTIAQTQAGSNAEWENKQNYANSTAGFNDRELARYQAKTAANAQFGAAAEAASAQRDSALAQAEAQKYAAQAAKEGGIFGALFGAVGNIAGGGGSWGRYW